VPSGAAVASNAIIAVRHPSVADPAEGKTTCSGMQVIAGLAAAEALDVGGGEGLGTDVAVVATALGAGDGVGGTQPTANVPINAIASSFIVTSQYARSTT
jgi:hypothetical protein